MKKQENNKTTIRTIEYRKEAKEKEKRIEKTLQNKGVEIKKENQAKMKKREYNK